MVQGRVEPPMLRGVPDFGSSAVASIARWREVAAVVVLAVLVFSGAPSATGHGARSVPSAHVSDASVDFRPSTRATTAPGPLPLAALPTWSPVVGLGTSPSKRTNPAMAYDSELSVVVLFGGYTGRAYLNDTWEFSNGTWTNVSASVGKPPPARSNADLADDPVDGYLVLWGGSDGSSVLSDTWAFNATGWHDLTKSAGTAPPSSYLASMTWDSADRYVVLMDGYNSGPTSETWKFIGGTWSELTSTGSGAPGGVEAGGMDYDANVGAVVYYDDFPNTYGQDGTWEFSNGSWTDEGVVPTPARAWPGMAYDGIDGYSLLFGGSTFSGHAPYDRNDTWALEGGSWTNLTSTGGDAPSVRDSPGMAFDAADGYLVLFGGENYTGSTTIYFGDTWTFGIFGPGNPPTPSVSVSANRSVTDVGLPIAFSAVPGGYGSAPYNYSWTFGDGTTAAGAAVVHTYHSAGAFAVTATITDAMGGQGNATVTETVHGDPSVSFTSSRSSPELGQVVEFNSSVSGGTGPFLWNWSFGDGSGAATPNASHVYATTGSVVVQLLVTDGLGVTAVQRLVESVVALPRVEFTASPNVSDVGLPVTFVATPGLGTPPYDYSWSFGGGTPIAQSSPTIEHAFSAAGTVAVDVMLRDAAGGVAWQNGTETIHLAPVATSTVQAMLPGSVAGATGSANLSTRFQFLVTVRGGTEPYSFDWSFGDGDTATTFESNHTYADVGNYTATVTVTDAVGATSHANLSVSVLPLTKTSPPPTRVPPNMASSAPAAFAGDLPYLAVAAVVIVAGVVIVLWSRRHPPVESEGSELPDEGGRVDSDPPTEPTPPRG